MTLTILEGSTFCICDERGDIGLETSGFFVEDTRYLSRFTLTMNGRAPLLLVSDKVEYFSAAFYLRNPLAGGLLQDSVSIVRERFVGEGMQDRIAVRNEGPEPVSLELVVEVGADFADIFAVKEHDFSLGDPLHARPLPTPVSGAYDAATGELVLEDPEEGSGAVTHVVFSQPGESAGGGGVRFPIELEPRGRWEVVVDVVAGRNGHMRPTRQRHFGEEVAHVRDSLTAWQLRVPQIRCTWDELHHAFERSVADLASLRMRGTDSGVGKRTPPACRGS
jgi:hypothetical protein